MIITSPQQGFAVGVVTGRNRCLDQETKLKIRKMAEEFATELNKILRQDEKWIEIEIECGSESYP